MRHRLTTTDVTQPLMVPDKPKFARRSYSAHSKFSRQVFAAIIFPRRWNDKATEPDAKSPSVLLRGLLAVISLGPVPKFGLLVRVSRAQRRSGEGRNSALAVFKFPNAEWASPNALRNDSVCFVPLNRATFNYYFVVVKEVERAPTFRFEVSL